MGNIRAMGRVIDADIGGGEGGGGGGGVGGMERCMGGGEAREMQKSREHQ